MTTLASILEDVDALLDGLAESDREEIAARLSEEMLNRRTASARDWDAENLNDSLKE